MISFLEYTSRRQGHQLVIHHNGSSLIRRDEEVVDQDIRTRPWMYSMKDVAEHRLCCQDKATAFWNQRSSRQRAREYHSNMSEFEALFDSDADVSRELRGLAGSRV